MRARCNISECYFQPISSNSQRHREKARKEESKARARVEEYASEGASVPYAPRALTSGELAVYSEFIVDHGRRKSADVVTRPPYLV